MDFQKLIKISRPRFWMYTVGPFLVGIAATGQVIDFPNLIRLLIERSDVVAMIGALLFFFMFVVYLGYFIFPANLLIYGVNDVADGDTDAFNIKKQGYENQLVSGKKELVNNIIYSHGIFLIGIVIIFVLYFFIITFGIPSIQDPGIEEEGLNHLQRIRYWLKVFIPFLITQSGLARLAFFFFSIFYSLPPIRAKSKPFIDGIFNVLYIIPGLIGYLTFGGASSNISRLGFFAGRLRCIAMHTYSAIPDIKPDAKAGLTTTAVLLGKKHTLFYCTLLRMGASAMGGLVIGPISYLFGIIYLVLIIISTKKDVMQVYTRFPYINALIGFLLFRIVVFL